MFPRKWIVALCVSILLFFGGSFAFANTDDPVDTPQSAETQTKEVAELTTDTVEDNSKKDAPASTTEELTEKVPVPEVSAPAPTIKEEVPVPEVSALTPTTEEETEPEISPAEDTILPIDVFVDGKLVKATNPAGNSVPIGVVIFDEYGKELVINDISPGETKSTTTETEACQAHAYVVIGGVQEFWGVLKFPDCSPPDPPVRPSFEGVLTQECTADGHVKFGNPGMDYEPQGSVWVDVLQEGGEVIASSGRELHPEESWTVELPNINKEGTTYTYHAYWVNEVEGYPTLIVGDVKPCGSDPAPTPTGGSTDGPESSVKPPTTSTKPSPTTTVSEKQPLTSLTKPGLPSAGKGSKSDDFGTPKTGVTDSGGLTPGAAILVMGVMVVAVFAARKALPRI